MSRITHKKHEDRINLPLDLVVSSLLLFISQYVFYNGLWPNGSRYDIPGILATLLMIIAFYYYLKNLKPHNSIAFKYYTKSICNCFGF